jgi:hypothetical protein
MNSTRAALLSIFALLLAACTTTPNTIATIQPAKEGDIELLVYPVWLEHVSGFEARSVHGQSVIKSISATLFDDLNENDTMDATEADLGTVDYAPLNPQEYLRTPSLPIPKKRWDRHLKVKIKITTTSSSYEHIWIVPHESPNQTVN